jgi:hypoxanthine phosphoribosyltransferase
VNADIVGVNLPNRFVVGSGMDVEGYWRNLPGLWAIRDEDLKPHGHQTVIR